MHTADEPADVVRELGIYFDADQRAACLRALLGGEPVDARLLMGELESEHARAARDNPDGPLCWEWLSRTAAGMPANIEGMEPLVRTVARDWGDP